MREHNAYKQYVATLVVSIMGFLFGIMNGWPSPAIFLLTSRKSPLASGPLSASQASWVASLKSIGMILGSMVVGFFAKKFGRKWPLIAITIPAIISWGLICWAQSVYFLYAARIIQGLVTAGTFSFGQLFLVEISDDSVRGACGSFMFLAINFGMVIAFTLGTYFSYHVTPLFAIAVNILFATLFFAFPETPQFLMKQYRMPQAEKSIRFYKNIDFDDRKSIDTEIERLKRQIGDDDGGTKKSMKWSELSHQLARNPGKKAMIIGIALTLLAHLSGNFALTNYTANIFKFAGSVLDPNESALIVAAIQFIATCMVPILIERAGRKPLYILSTVGSALGLSALGTYVLLKELHYHVESYGWIPIVSLSATVFVQALAISTLSMTVISEILPESLREFGVPFCNAIYGVGAFTVLKFSPLVAVYIGLHGLFFMFGGFCICGTLFIVFYVPEPKGKNYDEIMKLLE